MRLSLARSDQQVSPLAGTAKSYALYIANIELQPSQGLQMICRQMNSIQIEYLGLRRLSSKLSSPGSELGNGIENARRSWRAKGCQMSNREHFCD